MDVPAYKYAHPYTSEAYLLGHNIDSCYPKQDIYYPYQKVRLKLKMLIIQSFCALFCSSYNLYCFIIYVFIKPPAPDRLPNTYFTSLSPNRIPRPTNIVAFCLLIGSSKPKVA